MNKNIIIREYKDGDEVSIMKLRGLVLPGPKDMDWWTWQYKQNPAGEAIIIVAEDIDTKEIIGHNCFLPLRVKVANEIHLICAGTDVMVHPDYRGLGIYGQLRQRNTMDAKQRNVLFTYNFPNEFMLRIKFRTGQVPIFKKTPLWIKPLRIDNIATKYFRKSGKLASLITMVGEGVVKLTDSSRNYQIHTQVREIKEIDERFNTLWQQASSHHKIMLVRDRAYLDWRYVRKPDTDYTIYVSEDGDRLLGYIVLRVVENDRLTVGWIADILTESIDTKASMDLITKAIQHFKAIGVDMIMCVMPSKAYLARTLKKHGFFLVSKWRRTNTIRMRVIKPKYSESILTNPNNWYLTRGDSDLI